MATRQMGEVEGVLCARFQCPGYRLSGNSQAGSAMASTNPSGNTIRYDPAFMSAVLQSFGPDATTAILAHQLGHLIDFATNPSRVSQVQREATADEYAGCAFALAGYSEWDLGPMARGLHAMGASPGYSTPVERVALAGYRKCRSE